MVFSLGLFESKAGAGFHRCCDANLVTLFGNVVPKLANAVGHEGVGTHVSVRESEQAVRRQERDATGSSAIKTGENGNALASNPERKSPLAPVQKIWNRDKLSQRTPSCEFTRIAGLVLASIGSLSAVALGCYVYISFIAGEVGSIRGCSFSRSLRVAKRGGQSSCWLSE